MFIKKGKQLLDSKLLQKYFGYSFGSKQHKVPSWATCDPYTVSGKAPHTLKNFISGKWKDTQQYTNIVDPLNGETFLKVPDTQISQIDEVVANGLQVPQSGLHNPFKNPERYNMYGDIFFKIAAGMRDPVNHQYFTRLVQRVMPKSHAQCSGEVIVTRRFFENFTGDNPRFLCRSFNVSGDHDGQRSSGYRWPFGNVAIIAPFNFPIEIPCLQVFGALITGNRPTVKVDSKVSVVMEQFFRFAHSCGLPLEDLDFIHSGPAAMEEVVKRSNYRMIQFTGSSKVAQHLAKLTNGKVRLEDAGFDWKILGPDVFNEQYVAWQCDQDAYAASGQKCSAQSILYAHSNWVQKGFFQRLQQLAARRKLQDLSVGPVMTWTNQRIKAHFDSLLAIPGAQLLFGGKPLKNHQIPSVYGAYEPTAIFVPLDQITQNYELVTTELFGPFQVVTEWGDQDLNTLFAHLEGMTNHLTAAVVSNDPVFVNQVVGNTVNGVTYTGIRARTTGAPQNHWFGPAGDPRGAGIGTPQAILTVYTTHREVISDVGPIPSNWTTPQQN